MTEEGKIDPEAIKKLAAQHESKVVQDNENDKRALNQGFTGRATVYFKNNKKSQYHLDSESTKVLIERCDDCIIKFNSRIKTEMAEVWRCKNLHITINCCVKTLQLDLCENVTIHFTNRKYFDTVIWAGMHNFTLLVGESAETADKLETGVENIEGLAEFKEDFDQFIVRYVNGKLLQEVVVRLKNGFPTTDREADQFDEQKEKNDALYEKHIRQLLQTNIVKSELDELKNMEGAEKKEESSETPETKPETKPETTQEAPAPAEEGSYIQ